MKKSFLKSFKIVSLQVLNVTNDNIEGRRRFYFENHLVTTNSWAGSRPRDFQGIAATGGKNRNSIVSSILIVDD